MIAALIADDNADLLVVTENGYGKRTRISEYPRKGRGTMGVKTVQLTEAQGPAGGRAGRSRRLSGDAHVDGRPGDPDADGRDPPRGPVDAGRDRDAAAGGGREGVEPRAGRGGGRAGRRAARQTRRLAARPRPPSRRAGSRRRELAAAQARCRLFGRQRIHVDPAPSSMPAATVRRGNRWRCHQGPSWSQRLSGTALPSTSRRRRTSSAAVRSAAASEVARERSVLSRASARCGARRARPTRPGRRR